MAEESLLDRDTALSLLRPPQHDVATHNLQHSWSDNRFPLFGEPFLRVWDRFSGSQPDDNGCMESRSSRQRLDTRTSRKKSLAIHADYEIWKPTPYISFTTSAARIRRLVALRIERRGPQTLSVINPNARIANQLPILDMRAEMNYYGIVDPYPRSFQYYTDEYLCLWEVTPQEIVGQWQWADLVRNDQWYNEIILPAFKEHNKRLESTSLEEETLGLSAAFHELSGLFLALGRL